MDKILWLAILIGTLMVIAVVMLMNYDRGYKQGYQDGYSAYQLENHVPPSPGISTHKRKDIRLKEKEL